MRYFLPLFFVLMVILSYGVVRHLQNAGHNEQSAQTFPPDIYFYDKSGKKVTLEDFKGKVVLVNFWATWCMPCVAEMPFLDRLQEQMPKDRFQVVAISVDRSSLNTVEKFFKDHDIRHLELYWDQDREVPMKWKYEGLPTSYLLNEQGGIIARYDGPYEWDKPPLVTEISNLLR